jgi:phosphoglycerate dehydrogenase-like enzyme
MVPGSCAFLVLEAFAVERRTANGNGFDIEDRENGGSCDRSRLRPWQPVRRGARLHAVRRSSPGNRARPAGAEKEHRMSKPRVYVHRLAESYSLYMNDENEAALESFAEVVSERDRVAPMSSDELIERMQGCRAILSLNGCGAWEITADVLKAVGSVELICISHWMEQFVGTAREAGVEVCEGSNANTVAVAEWTITAALMGVRKIAAFNGALKSGSPWGEPRREVGLLCESTVGLIGMDRIGWYVAQYFRALGARVIVHDRDKTRANELGLPLVGIDELMRTADVVSLHLPVTPSTKGLLGAKEFALLKDGAVFINSARAALYDEDALVAELKKNRFTALLDVFAHEPLAPDHPFRSMDNVTINPHIAGDNKAMFLRCGREAVETPKEYFEGKGVRNLQYRFP